jgi:hypothetical protein
MGKETDMTESAEEHKERLEAAAKSVAAKLQSFQDGLTADEHLMLGLAINAVAATRSDEDVAGYSYSDGIGEVRDWCLTWRWRPGLPLPTQPPYTAR